MIGKVSGRLDYRAGDHVLIDTGGVGYLVYCSDRTLARMPGPGGAVALYTDLTVREDLLQLIGFPTLAEREWHRLLVSVQGVGARAALAVLGALGPDGVGRALARGDVNAIKAAPGVGPKLAQRIVLELRDKSPAVIALGAAGAREATPAAPSAAAADAPAHAPPTGPEASAAAAEADASADALSALMNLGYGAGEAAAAVADAGGGGLAAPALIRAALKRLGPPA